VNRDTSRPGTGKGAHMPDREGESTALGGRIIIVAGGGDARCAYGKGLVSTGGEGGFCLSCRGEGDTYPAKWYKKRDDQLTWGEGADERLVTGRSSTASEERWKAVSPWRRPTSGFKMERKLGGINS